MYRSAYINYQYGMGCPIIQYPMYIHVHVQIYLLRRQYHPNQSVNSSKIKMPSNKLHSVYVTFDLFLWKKTSSLKSPPSHIFSSFFLRHARKGRQLVDTVREREYWWKKHLNKSNKPLIVVHEVKMVRGLETWSAVVSGQHKIMAHRWLIDFLSGPSPNPDVMNITYK